MMQEQTLRNGIGNDSQDAGSRTGRGLCLREGGSSIKDCIKQSRIQHGNRIGAVPFERVPGTEVIGGEQGLEGFKQAVLYVYKILEPPGLEESKYESLLYPVEETDQSWPSPRVSAATGIAAISMDDYVGQLWDHCWKVDPSTFGALYLWTAAWYIDLGNAYNITLLHRSRLGNTCRIGA